VQWSSIALAMGSVPQAEPERVIHEIEEFIGFEATNAPTCSAKTGLGVEGVLETLVDVIPLE
ncbi:hypothetical protein, partial [Klebsiella pneumoniae]|uniref:hypothetical protein n=1 Tax=Klebsiella pneumoniae TaxID=573 RepID=UPI001952C586